MQFRFLVPHGLVLGRKGEKEERSTAITRAKRLAEFLGDALLKDKGLSCHLR